MQQWRSNRTRRVIFSAWYSSSVLTYRSIFFPLSRYLVDLIVFFRSLHRKWRKWKWRTRAGFFRLLTFFLFVFFLADVQFVQIRSHFVSLFLNFSVDFLWEIRAENYVSVIESECLIFYWIQWRNLARIISQLLFDVIWFRYLSTSSLISWGNITVIVGCLSGTQASSQVLEIFFFFGLPIISISYGITLNSTSYKVWFGIR